MNSIELNNLAPLSANSEPDPTADIARANPPGLAMITYRGGQYKPTVQRMLAQLSSEATLMRLNRDAYDDWSIAMLHAWSIVTDVLSFYQERITNEGYIRTAAERRSVLSLAQALGYDWRPGLAANVDLALTVAPDDQGLSQQITVPQGSAVQSTPVEGQLPQIFETSVAAEVRTDWNLFLPYVGVKATEAGATDPLLIDITSMRVANYRNDLQVGDVILLVDQANRQPNSLLHDFAATNSWVLGTLTEVVADPQKPYTIIRWTVDDHGGTEIQQPALFVFRQKVLLFGYAQGAVYFDGEEKPVDPKPTDPTTNGQTNNTPPAPNPAPGSGTVTVATRRAVTVATRPSATPAPDPTNPSPPNNGKPGDQTDGNGNATKADPPPKEAQWTPRTLSLPNLDINTFIVNGSGAIFAGTKRDLFRSLDNGESWQPVGVDPVGRNITALTLDPEGNLLAGSSTGGIYLSYDNGDNWTPVSGDSVAPDIKVTKAQGSDTFTVDPPKTLPKAPVLDLEFGKDQGGNTVLYALAGKDLFPSSDRGKTWGEKIDPANELPATLQRPSATAQRDAMLAAANGLLTAARLQWLEQIVTPVAKGVGATKWFGLDLWDFLRAQINQAPTGANAVRALAVSTQGKKSTVVVGTDAGKFTLKEKTRRWLVALMIVLLVLVQQFIIHHKQLGLSSMEIAATGAKLKAVSILPNTEPITATTAILIQGMPEFASGATLPGNGTYHFTLNGMDKLAATLDGKKKLLIASGNLPLKGKMEQENASYPFMLTAISTLTSTVDTATGVTNTIFALTTTEAANVALTLSGTAIVTAEKSYWPAAIQIKVEKVTGALAPGTPFPADKPATWIASIWQPIVDLLQTTVIASWNGLKGFLSDLWAALPSWIKALLTPLNDWVIQPVIRFIDTYLIKPLLNYTAATLLDVSYITLAVLAFLLAWIYADRKMSNRQTVRLTGPVNAVAIHSNGQIFAGTKEGIFRSVADDPNASWWTKATRLLIRRAFPDVPMEPINHGLADPPPDIRALSFTNTGALLAGTADGRIFRLSDPTAELDPNLNTPTVSPSITNPGTPNPSTPNPGAPNTGPINPGGTNPDTTSPEGTNTTDPNPAPLKIVKWARYDQGIIVEDKSTLKAVRTLSVTTVGQFVAGSMGDNKVEDRWFTAQVKEMTTPDGKKIKMGEIDLDGIYPNLKVGSWLVLRQPSGGLTEQGTPRMKYARYQVVDVQRVRSLDFVTVGEFTRAFVQDDGELTKFSRTRAEILIQSEPISLFDNRPVMGNVIYLNNYVPDLVKGHRLIVSGKQKLALITETLAHALLSDNGLESRTLQKGDILQVVPLPKPDTKSGATTKCDPTQTPCPWRLRTRDGFVGTVWATSAQIRWVFPPESEPEVSEVATVLGAQTISLADEGALQAGIDYAYNRVTLTQVELTDELMHVYDRASVTIYGNVVAATHGKTVADEVLGSGSGMQANERFRLKEGPLTYVSAANDQGSESQITVSVNEIEWQKEPYLYGLARDQRAYIVRQDALDNTFITFGDGKQGARLPTGTELVSATYRIGLGPVGNVPPYTIDQPQTLPSAIRRVTNPLAATGGVGPDSTADVRARAPLSVRIMNRIVALSDYEDYVRLYAGIGRVQLKKFGSGPGLLLHFTVADAAGNPFPQGAPILTNLVTSINERRAVATPQLKIDSYEQRYFDLAAEVWIYPEHHARANEIAQIIRQKLLTAFSFDAREFGQDVAESEVVALLQDVTGVAVVVSVQLKDAKEPKAADEDTPNDRLIGKLARSENDEILPAQLWLLNPGVKGVDLKIASTSDPTKVLNDQEVTA